MGLVYFFALVLALGLLLLQIFLGGKGDTQTDHDLVEDVDHDVDATDHDPSHDAAAEGGILALFLSTRFWVFFALAFGLSGSLLHHLELAGTVVTLVIASGSGLAAGCFAVIAFRTLKRTSTNTSTSASEAIGRTGKVLVACGRGKTGQIRVEVKGQSLDLLATTDEEEIGRGKPILVVDIKDNVAHISSRPSALE